MQMLYSLARIGDIIGALNFKYFLGILSDPMLLSRFICLMCIKTSVSHTGFRKKEVVFSDINEAHENWRGVSLIFAFLST